MHFSHILRSKKNILSIAFALFLTFFSLNVSALEGAVAEETATAHAKETEKEKEFDISTFILHHIADAHSFHLWGEGENSVGIPLPVILWTESGLIVFMSGEFHHDAEGKVVVEKEGSVL